MDSCVSVVINLHHRVCERVQYSSQCLRNLGLQSYSGQCHVGHQGQNTTDAPVLHEMLSIVVQSAFSSCV